MHVLSSLGKVEFAQKQMVVSINVAIGVPLQILTISTSLPRLSVFIGGNALTMAYKKDNLSWEMGIHFLIDRHLGSQDEGRLYKEISHVIYGLHLRRGGIVGGINIHKLVANQARCLTNMGICDHIVSWVDQICS